MYILITRKLWITHGVTAMFLRPCDSNESELDGLFYSPVFVGVPVTFLCEGHNKLNHETSFWLVTSISFFSFFTHA